MKVGSLVTLKTEVPRTMSLVQFVKEVPVMGVIYTVRGIVEQAGYFGIYLEEIIVGYVPNGEEISTWMDLFKEVQPPLECTIEEFIGETEPELV